METFFVMIRARKAHRPLCVCVCPILRKAVAHKRAVSFALGLVALALVHFREWQAAGAAYGEVVMFVLYSTQNILDRYEFFWRDDGLTTPATRIEVVHSSGCEAKSKC